MSRSVYTVETKATAGEFHVALMYAVCAEELSNAVFNPPMHSGSAKLTSLESGAPQF